MKKIYIDPGHATTNAAGVTDPGATGNGMREHEVVMGVGQILAGLLQSQYDVRLSRAANTNAPTIAQRQREANDWGADAYVSLHNNSVDDDTANGCETFYAEGKPQDEPFARVIHDNFVSRFAHLRDRGLKIARAPINGRAQPGGFGIMNNLRMPSCVAELAFITADANRFRDAYVLRNERRQMAEALAAGIRAYFPTAAPAPEAPRDLPVRIRRRSSGTSYESRVRVVNIGGANFLSPNELTLLVVKAFNVETTEGLVQFRDFFENLGFEVSGSERNAGGERILDAWL